MGSRILRGPFFVRGYLPTLQVLPRYLWPHGPRSRLVSGGRLSILANCSRRVLGGCAFPWRIVAALLLAVAAGFALARTCCAAFARISRGDFHLAQFRQL